MEWAATFFRIRQATYPEEHLVGYRLAQNLVSESTDDHCNETEGSIRAMVPRTDGSQPPRETP